MDVSGRENEIQCCKEQCCIGTWNVRSKNQGILDVVKQQMAKMNIASIVISEMDGNG